MRRHAVGMLLFLLGITRAEGFAQTPITSATISAVVPDEVKDGSGANLPVAVGALPLDFFDNYSWCSFVALNWPAKSGVRGEADTTKTVGDAGKRVWETWKAGYETIPSDATAANAPTPWASLDGKTPCPGVPSAGSGTKRIIGWWPARAFADYHQAGFGRFDESNPLVCQDATYARYELHVNKPEYEHIRSRKLYLRSTIEGLTAPERFPNGSIEVKTAWRELGGDVSDDEAKTYYTIKAQMMDYVTGTCTEKRLGMIGFHIVQKTPLRPQWIWSTFEHIKNVPKHGSTPAAAEKFTLNDASATQATTDPPPTPLTSGSPPSASPAPTQVVRARPLHPAAPGNIGTEAMNARYHAALAGTVWTNYQLVATQWPTKPLDPGVVPPDNIKGTPFPVAANAPTAVENVALESYHQSTSCMGCHDAARKAKLDFVFFVDFAAFNDTGFDGIQPRSLDLLRANIAEAEAAAAGN